jgi:hypothetical protein
MAISATIQFPHFASLEAMPELSADLLIDLPIRYRCPGHLINYLRFIAVGLQVHVHYTLQRFHFGMRNQPFNFITNSLFSLAEDDEVPFILRAVAEALDQQVGHQPLLTALYRYANGQLNLYQYFRFDA